MSLHSIQKFTPIIGCNPLIMEIRGMPHTRLLGIPLLILLINSTWGNQGNPCKKYYTLYREGEAGSLIRIHTNLNLNCVNLSGISTSPEDGKTYWFSQNIATYGQQLLGECPVGDAWLCF